MKKATLSILIILAVLSLCSCKKQSTDTPKPTGEYTIISSSEYSLNSKEGEGAIIQDYVSDAATAQAIGDAVIKSIVGEEGFSQLIDVRVSYDLESGIWILNRNLGADTLGGDYTCAIKKSNGEILKVWAGE